MFNSFQLQGALPMTPSWGCAPDPVLGARHRPPPSLISGCAPDARVIVYSTIALLAKLVNKEL